MKIIITMGTNGIYNFANIDLEAFDMQQMDLLQKITAIIEKYNKDNLNAA